MCVHGNTRLRVVKFELGVHPEQDLRWGKVLTSLSFFPFRDKRLMKDMQVGLSLDMKGSERAPRRITPVCPCERIASENKDVVSSGSIHGRFADPPSDPCSEKQSAAEYL